MKGSSVATAWVMHSRWPLVVELVLTSHAATRAPPELASKLTRILAASSSKPVPWRLRLTPPAALPTTGSWPVGSWESFTLSSASTPLTEKRLTS